ncbi:MAG TPA: 50S ribosomal protein L4 [Ignisphaera aggregans]|uniref:Large ribosomal subunit protein uL4 n=1 Tax=Ignisphaera aggregans TaxID=334771 RepID=A0A832Z021_9CREN|nr:50S ribosomal protein L4 [Ignisphaera aggregans]
MVKAYITPLLREPGEVPVYNLDGSIVDKVRLPNVFGLPVRIDVIRRAVHSALTARIQPKGRDPLAGKRRCGESWGIGYGLARVPRLDNGRAVFAPNVVGGRRQFAPSPLKKIHEEINRKEMRLAIMSALAATAIRDFVIKRGHHVPPHITQLPVVVVDDFENIKRTKELRQVLEKIGLWSDILRAAEKTRIRAGKGKMRGRRYVTPKSILFIVSSLESSVINAIKNLPGSDYATPFTLNILTLAPGGHPGRLTVFTRSALSKIAELYPVIKA